METLAEDLKRYVRFSETDASRVARLASRVAPHFERIAAEFYERIREHEQAHAVLSGEEQIDRLRRSLVAWLERLFGGVYDEAYFAKTEQIGRVHVRVGLPPRYVFAAMSLVRASLLSIVNEGAADVPARDALGRLIDIEIAVMMDAYHGHLLGRIERATEQREDAERRRATSFEENAAVAIRIAPMLVVATDASGSIVLFNRTAEVVTGFAEDEVLGWDFASVLRLGPEDPPRDLGKEEDVELPLATRAGTTRRVRWRIVQAEHAALTFAFGIDITDDSATRELDERQRRLAALGTLTTGLAHEIRNPLNGARLHAAYLERALASQNAPDLVEAVVVVKNEIQRLARLVDEFLEFAQPRALEPTSVDARVLIERVIRDAKNVRMDLAAAELPISGDAVRLERMLRNLVANALEAGAKDVVVRVRREPRFVRFEIEDDGPGFDPKAPVFDAFYTTKGDGTGLGLAIAHRIVTDHEGTIDVESRPGYTRFRIRLPVTGSIG